ncbi:hypothetical protein E2562_003510 [Oryza meyeriana var. granulata]|uniref:RanBP2-type domain-containing protein n=1 Tax=Oryza meyeriana var. granulata TaxID=110450 RepID=A0A6G1CMZ9_9ORYZ|nr:hypothetical protein E2562_003510 [Oryza meyeriana var. granulata]
MAQGPARQQSSSSRPPPRQNNSPRRRRANLSRHRQAEAQETGSERRSRRHARRSCACEACSSTRPVEVVDAADDDDLDLDLGALASASFLPLRRCSQKRGRAGRPSQQWSCAVCTLVNSGGSRACEACSSTRPVEVVDAATDDDLDLDLGVLANTSFLPLRRCSQKRGCAASPGAMEVRPDEGDGTKGREDKEAEKKLKKGPSGNSQPHGKTDLGLDDIEEFLYDDDAAGTKEVDINELEVYMKEKPIR